MDITQINTSLLRSLLKLSERKEILLQELSRVEAEIEAVTAGKPAPKAAAPAAEKAPAKAKGPAKKAKSPAPAATGKRGAVKEKIISLLSAAGSQGASVKELAAKIGLPPQNVHVWFSSTGKKLGIFERVKPGHFKIAK